MFTRYPTFARVCGIALGLSGAGLAAGCNAQQNLIDHVVFTPSTDLSTISVALVFTNNIQSTFNGMYELANYGSLFVDGYSATQPFEVGFTLDTAVFNDQNYAKLTPTTFLPNGMSNGVGYPMAQIAPVNPISSVFNLYGYVDILHQSWLGAAAMFSFINNQYFPNGLSISEAFLNDSAGAPGLIASVFGPTVNAEGQLSQAGGISIFANVRQLITHSRLQAGQALIVRPTAVPQIAGPQAAEYVTHPSRLRTLETNLIRAFNSQN